MKHSVTEHEGERSLQGKVEKIRIRLHGLDGKGQLSMPLQEALLLLGQMQDFGLGRQLLLHGSLDGYWTRYCVYQQSKDRRQSEVHTLEDFILNQSPIFLATQERFSIFQTQLQKRLRDGMALASIPCGYMDDLLTLDYRNVAGVALTGFDIDPKSCAGAFENAKQCKIDLSVQTHCLDAWQVGRAFPNAFDAITSNGLNIYVADPEKEAGLYLSFADALKKGGVLITSFVTPPPGSITPSPWQDYNPEMLSKQKLVLGDILGVKWQNYNTAETMTEKLDKAGFSRAVIIYDRCHVFPTIVAEKR